MSHRRIVITGMGAVSPLGCGVEAIWQRLLKGESGIRALPDEIVADLPVKVGGQVPALAQDAEAGFNPDASVAPKDQKKMDRFILFAMVAADEAIRQAGWIADTEEKQERTATVIASGIGGFPAIAQWYAPLTAVVPSACRHLPSLLSGQSGGRPRFHQASLQRPDWRTGHRLCGRRAGHRRRSAIAPQ